MNSKNSTNTVIIDYFRMSQHITSAQNPETNHVLDHNECKTQLTDPGVTGESSNSLETLLPPLPQSNHLHLHRQHSEFSESSSAESSSSSCSSADRDMSASFSDGSAAVDSDDDDSKRSSVLVSKQSAANQSELRKQIMKIQADTSIPPGDKAKKIQVRNFAMRLIFEYSRNS